MNILLFEPYEINSTIDINDRRIKHLIKVIGIEENQLFDAGIINQSIGKAKYTYIDKGIVKIHYQISNTIPEKPIPIHVILGMIRPVNIQRVVRDLCTLGISHIHFVRTDKSEKSYSNSRAYESTRLHQYLIEGAEQAFNPFIPNYSFYNDLNGIVTKQTIHQKFAFDNYNHSLSWGQVNLKKEPVILALGPERGWSNKERNLLLEHNFTLCSLGKRVLRSETAIIAAVSISLGKLSYM